jgi:hypothetical protein
MDNYNPQISSKAKIRMTRPFAQFFPVHFCDFLSRTIPNVSMYRIQFDLQSQARKKTHSKHYGVIRNWKHQSVEFLGVFPLHTGDQWLYFSFHFFVRREDLG